MGSCSLLATNLDREMLENRINPVQIAASTMPDNQLPIKSGADVLRELKGRYLLRYLLPHQIGLYINGSNDQHWVTPTPYTPEETISWLALPNPSLPRTFVMLLDPSKIDEIKGPRWVRLGKGIEYLLHQGFPPEALLLSWPLQVA